MSKIFTPATRSTFLALFNQTHVRLKDHWSDYEGSKPLKIVSRQIVLEDGTIIQLKAGD